MLSYTNKIEKGLLEFTLTFPAFVLEHLSPQLLSQTSVPVFLRRGITEGQQPVFMS